MGSSHLSWQDRASESDPDMLCGVLFETMTTQCFVLDYTHYDALLDAARCSPTVPVKKGVNHFQDPFHMCLPSKLSTAHNRDPKQCAVKVKERQRGFEIRIITAQDLLIKCVWIPTSELQPRWSSVRFNWKVNQHTP